MLYLLDSYSIEALYSDRIVLKHSDFLIANLISKNVQNKWLTPNNKEHSVFPENHYSWIFRDPIAMTDRSKCFNQLF